MLGDRLGRDGLTVEEPLVLPAVAEVGDDGRDPAGARVADRIREEEELDDHRIRVRRLHEHDVLACDGAEEADVPFSRATSTKPARTSFAIPRASGTDAEPPTTFMEPTDSIEGGGPI